MKKQLAMVSLLSVAAVSMFATSASAADPVTTSEETTVGIEFNEDGTNIGKGPFKDNLGLVFKPGAFEFGKVSAVVGQAKTYSNTVTDDQFIVVNDDRPETSATDKTRSPWELKAQLSKITSGTDELTSTLTYDLEAAQSYVIGSTVNENTNEYDPINHPVKDADKAFPTDAPTLTGKDIVLGATTGLTKTSMKLEAGASGSTRVMAKTFKNEFKGGVASKVTSTKLTVPNGTGLSGKVFKGTVTWSLTNALSN